MKLVTETIAQLAGQVEADLVASKLATARLTHHLGDVLSIPVREALLVCESGGLTAQDILDASEEEVAALAAALTRLDSTEASDG